MTTAAVPSTDPVDFLLNVETLDEAINSSGQNLVDRLGNTRSTLNGAINSLKAFNVRGAWVTATAYAIKDVYTSAGIAYVTVVAHISSSIAADLAAGKVTIHQGATKEELSASSGTSLIGFKHSAVGSVTRTTKSKLDDSVSVWDFFLAVEVDHTGMFQRALDSSVAASVLVPDGAYTVSDCLNNTNGYRSLKGSGSMVGATITSTSTDYIIDCTGTNNGGLKNLKFISATARVGIYYNRSSTVGFAQYNKLKNVVVELASAPAANGGVGSVAYYNRSSELNLVEGCNFVADVPAIIRAGTNALFQPIYVLEGATVSMTSMKLDSVVLYSHSTSKPALYLDNVGAITSVACYIGTASVSGSPVPAINVTVMDGCDLQFDVEGYAQSMSVSSLAQANQINIYAQNSSPTGIIYLGNGNTGLVSFVGNECLLKSGGSLSTLNHGVYSDQATVNLYVSSNFVHTAGGTGSPLGWINAPVSSEFNFELSESKLKLANSNFADGAFYPKNAAGVNWAGNPAIAGQTSRALTDYAEGTWTPNQGAGLTVVGAFSSSGTYTKTGRLVTLQGTIAGATSIAVAAGAVISNNAPFSASPAYVGMLANGSLSASGGILISGGVIYALNAIGASPSITFTISLTV